MTRGMYSQATARRGHFLAPVSPIASTAKIIAITQSRITLQGPFAVPLRSLEGFSSCLRAKRLPITQRFDTVQKGEQPGAVWRRERHAGDR